MSQSDLTQEIQKLKIAALADTINSALQYGEEGLKLALQILNNKTGYMKLVTYDLLWKKLDEEGKRKLLEYLRTNEGLD